MTNVVVLRGRLTRPAALRSLPSGDQLLALDLSIQRDGERAETAPVVWPDAPAAATALDVDQEVVVVGRVRRRFFRADGSTQSRTEVVADVVVPASQTKRANAALARALARLEPRPGGRPTVKAKAG
ncbi:MAG TPA: single-stranded DNA-binding protein [Acidimicrobiales bacterium]|nr:single-stranded DNA-binding protein [Acidimicrobiales bacterium]